MKKVLITGVTAFVGSHLADKLVKEGVEVHGIKRPRSRDEFINPGVIYHEADVTDYVGVTEIIKEVKPEVIFHLAAQSFVPLSWQAPTATLNTNIIGTLNILEGVRKLSPDTRVQVAGSSEEYGMVWIGETPIKETNPLRPMSPYGVSKVAADLLAQQYYMSYGVRTIITRAFNHEGPRRGENFVTSNFAKQVALIEKGRQDPVIKVGNLEASRDFTDVRDMIVAYCEAVRICSPGEPYNICSGKAYKIQEVLDILLGYSKVEVKIEQDENRMRPSDVPLLLGDYSKFKQRTRWTPKIPFEQTLLDTLDYWRAKL